MGGEITNGAVWALVAAIAYLGLLGTVLMFVEGRRRKRTETKDDDW